MALEIIGAGFGRTGTYSLKAALERLGFGPCHHMSEVIGDPAQIKLWSDVVDGHSDNDRIFSGFRAAVDFPVSAYCGRKSWHQSYPILPRCRGLVRQLLTNNTAPHPRPGGLAGKREAMV